MALSGVNQSHVQPVWAQIPSRSGDIGAVPRFFAASPTNPAGALAGLSAPQAPQLLVNPVNSQVLNQGMEVAIDDNDLGLLDTSVSPPVGFLGGICVVLTSKYR